MNAKSKVKSNNLKITDINQKLSAIKDKITSDSIVVSNTTELQEKTVTPNESVQIVTPDTNKYLSKVTVNAIPSEYKNTSDATATESDILEGKTAYVNGTKITGTHTDVMQTKVVTPTKEAQTITPDSGYSGLSQVRVNPIPPEYVIVETQEKTVTPSIDSQVITPDSGKYLSKVTVNAIPDMYVIPNGSLSIVNNGTYNVSRYAQVEVNISSGSTLSETVTLNTDGGDVVVTAPPKEARNQAWFILTVPGQSKFFLYVTPFGWGRYNQKYYVIKQNGTELEGSADYPYLLYEMSTSTPLGTWAYSGSGYASTQAYNYWAEASNTDIYNWSNLSTKGSTVHFAKNTD